MLLEMMVAAVIGISFGNVWICIFMGFGTSAEHKSAGKWFIAGRFLGLMPRSLAIRCHADDARLDHVRLERGHIRLNQSDV